MNHYVTLYCVGNPKFDYVVLMQQKIILCLKDLYVDIILEHISSIIKSKHQRWK